MKVAKDLGYQSNYQAIRFRQNKSGLIGLIILEMGMFIFPAVVKAIEEIVKKNGYNSLVGVIQAIYEKCLSIPEELAVICISNGNLPYYLNPQITHIRHSGYAVGKAAVELLFDLMNDKVVVDKHQLELETFLVALDSC